MSRYVFQRAVNGKWFDAEKFEDRERALSTLRREQQWAESRIRGWGGSGYTQERVQEMRVIEVISQ